MAIGKRPPRSPCVCLPRTLSGCDYVYGPEFSINTGIHLVGAIRGNGKAAVWQERRPGLEFR